MKFECKCGSTELLVSRLYETQDQYGREVWKQTGPLYDNHQWSYDYEIMLDSYSKFNSDLDEDEPVEIPASIEFYVNCAGCEREIEFGWSHSDRGGRIWPVECDDFEPGRGWMEPRYNVW